MHPRVVCWRMTDHPDSACMLSLAGHGTPAPPIAKTVTGAQRAARAIGYGRNGGNVVTSMGPSCGVSTTLPGQSA